MAHGGQTPNQNKLSKLGWCKFASLPGWGSQSNPRQNCKQIFSTRAVFVCEIGQMWQWVIHQHKIFTPGSSQFRSQLGSVLGMLSLKGIVPQFVSIAQISYYIDSNRVWYRSFWSEGFINSINFTILVLDIVPRDLKWQHHMGPWMAVQGPRMEAPKDLDLSENDEIHDDCDDDDVGHLWCECHAGWRVEGTQVPSATQLVVRNYFMQFWTLLCEFQLFVICAL